MKKIHRQFTRVEFEPTTFTSATDVLPLDRPGSNLQPIKPGTPGQKPSQMQWVLLCALHNTLDQQLYVPSGGRSNNSFKSVLVKDTNDIFGNRTQNLLNRNTRASYLQEPALEIFLVKIRR